MMRRKTNFVLLKRTMKLDNKEEEVIYFILYLYILITEHYKEGGYYL